MIANTHREIASDFCHNRKPALKVTDNFEWTIIRDTFTTQMNTTGTVN